MSSLAIKEVRHPRQFRYLLEDARRDWTALGGVSADVQPVGNWKIDEPITLEQGVMFVTYPTLRSARGDHSRLKQILDWAGEDFEGVIFFDEAHEMGGVAGGEGALGAKAGSQQGICGVLLQNHLPGARVGYASATGASDINNLAYAVRLGLWGPETSFADREQFISSIRQGGIAAMELVARDLKASGLYLARALSFAGVEYDILKHELTPAQIEIYDIYADAWAIIHRNMEAALELTGVVDGLEGNTLNSGAKASARSRFESTKQRFFATGAPVDETANRDRCGRAASRRRQIGGHAACHHGRVHSRPPPWPARPGRTRRARYRPEPARIRIMLRSTLQEFLAVRHYLERSGRRLGFASLCHDFTPDNYGSSNQTGRRSRIRQCR